MTTPKSSERNMPHLNATIDRWMDDWIRSMAESSGLHASRILREIIALAHRQGFTPGRVSLGDMKHRTAMRTGNEPHREE